MTPSDPVERVAAVLREAFDVCIEDGDGSFDVQGIARAAIAALSPPPDSGVVEALEKCRDTFAEYAELHRRKLGTQRPSDSAEFQAIIRKVERNREMADMCDAALAKVQP